MPSARNEMTCCQSCWRLVQTSPSPTIMGSTPCITPPCEETPGMKHLSSTIWCHTCLVSTRVLIMFRWNLCKLILWISINVCLKLSVKPRLDTDMLNLKLLPQKLCIFLLSILNSWIMNRGGKNHCFLDIVWFFFKWFSIDPQNFLIGFQKVCSLITKSMEINNWTAMRNTLSYNHLEGPKDSQPY